MTTTSLPFIQMLQSSNRYASTAVALQPFVSIYDDLLETREMYGDTEFGQKYNALPGAVKSAFSALGVNQLAVSEGTDVFDSSRMVAIESVHDRVIPDGVVLSVLKPGFELQGNIIRMAECVVSLGPEPVVSEATEESAAAGEAESADEAAKDESKDA
jgi:molecular chaperone GrpE (heat shock protein)